MNESIPTVVLYHADCIDGFTAAWAAWQRFGDRATYRPVQYGQTPPEIPEGADLHLVDFSYPAEILATLAGRAGTLTLLDHHATAGPDVERVFGARIAQLPDGRGQVRIEPGHSGAWLAWRHYRAGHPMPQLVAYVEDRDLWRWALPYSREISAWLRSWPFDFDVWSECAAALEAADTLDHAVQQAVGILRAQVQLVEQQCRRAVLHEVGGHQVPILNATLYISEIGECLCRLHPEAPYSATFFDRADGAKVWSLRSRGDCDVGALAKTLGGGGHPRAAGFVEPETGSERRVPAQPRQSGVTAEDESRTRRATERTAESWRQEAGRLLRECNDLRARVSELEAEEP